MSRLILAVPRGRILKELVPLLARCSIEGDKAFHDPDSRALRFSTNHPDLELIRVRSFDVATFVAFGAAHIGIVGSDVLMEFDYDQIYAPLDCRIGACRLVLAAAQNAAPIGSASHVRVATKYPRIAQRHFAQRAIQAECIKLHGAMEIAPALGLSSHIIDLVSTGKTLAANGLHEVETIAEVTARLIVNRTAYKTRAVPIKRWINRMRQGMEGKKVS